MITKIEMVWPSLALLRPVNIAIGLPSQFSFARPPYKCLWALHCSMENGNFFFEKLDCSAIVENLKAAVIAPSLGNSYFINTGYEAQGDFLEELLTQLPRILPLSAAREDNAVIGVSMGGFGAVRWALASEKFSQAAAISGVFDCHVPDDERVFRDRKLKAIYAAFKKNMLKCLLNSNETTRPEADLSLLAQNCRWHPMIRLYCGQQDYIAMNQTLWLENMLRAAGFPAALDIFSGGHDAVFWKEAFHLAAHEMLSSKQVGPDVSD